MESYVIARPTGRIENGKHAKKIDKKGIREFLIIFVCSRYGCLMNVAVYENCRIHSTSIWYKNHQDILNVTKVKTAYIQEPRLKNLVRFQSGHKGLRVPHPMLLLFRLRRFTSAMVKQTELHSSTTRRKLKCSWAANLGSLINQCQLRWSACPIPK